MTERPNQQLDVGEPAFSPDGRYVYYSRDASGGSRFQYNKDPHAGIYVIDRFDRQEGRSETLIGGAGGAIRPTPSHNGKLLAFIRRVDTKSVLFVRDLQTGLERALYDGLDRDMQETWAIHGVYPAMAWLPGDRGIVVWAGGKIRRVELDSGESSTIEFHVKDTRQVLEALRTPQEAHPKRFDTKMLRWVQVAPNGKSVVYQALGKLYVRSLPDGRPRRLTRDEHDEFYPSFSRDGKYVVYTSYSDSDYGSVRVVSAGGGRSRSLTSEPGHYVEPQFAPDGRSVVYRKIRGGWTRSVAHSNDPGIYRIGVRGGRPELLSRRGSRPHFGADPNRLYFTSSKGSGTDRKFQLMGLDLDDRETHELVSGANTREFAVSPTGAWVAYRDRFDAFVSAMPATGRSFSVAAGSKAAPLAKVSDDAGYYLHWSGDGERLHWSLGPELFSMELDESFAFLKGDAPVPEAQADTPTAVKDKEAKPKDKPRRTGINIGFSIDADLPEGSIALVGARIVTMRGDEIIEDGVVVIENNRIKAVGKRGEVELPKRADSVIELGGRTLIPGLIDVHAHGSQGRDGLVPRNNWLNHSMLSFGVTTMHDPSNDTETFFAAAEMARAGETLAPRLFSTGTILYGATTTFTAKIDSLEDARKHLRRQQAMGAFSVKSYNQPRRNQRQQVVEAARGLGMLVVPEGGSLLQHNLTMVVDGHTGVEHAIPVARIYEDIQQLWSQTKVGYTPTQVVGYGGVWGENFWYQDSDVHEHGRLTSFVPRFAYADRARRRMHVSKDDWNHISIARICEQLDAAGVSVQLGAHGQREGLAAHWELWSFVQGGMSPHRALRAATLRGAEYIGMQAELGSIEEGKLADLVVIAGDPLTNIRDSEKVEFVVLNGRLYDAATLDQVAPKVRKHVPFFWQSEPGEAMVGAGVGTQSEVSLPRAGEACSHPGGH